MHSELKTTHINVRMSPEERAAITARSASFEMTPSAFMRESALLRDEKPVRVADADELRGIHTNLKRVGNLLNQSARLAHTYGLDGSTLPLLESAVRSVSEAASRISGLLSQNKNEG